MKFNTLIVLFAFTLNIINAQNLINDFNIDIKSFDKVIELGISNNRLLKHFKEDVVSVEEKKHIKFNELTGEHDLIVISSKIVIKHNGSILNVETESLEIDYKINRITIGFRCICDWFTFKPENIGYILIENSDNPDKKNSYLGGIQKKYKKSENILFFHKFHSRPYFEFSISKIKPKEKESNTSKEFISKAIARHKSSDPIKAIEYANKAIDLDKKNANTYFTRGLIRNSSLNKNLEFKKGSQSWLTMEDYNQSIFLDSTSNVASSFYEKRAELNYKLKKVNKSISDYEKSLNLKPEKEKTRLSLISILIDNKFESKAKENLEYLINNKSINPDTYTLSALLKWNSKDKKGACVNFKKAKKLGLKLSGRLDLFEMNQTCR